MKQINKKILLILATIVFTLNTIVGFATQNPTAIKKELKVHFIDVGQADCSLIQTPNGKNILIDAGNNEDAKLITQYLKERNITKLDAVIGTHPHEDHIGAMDDVIKSFEIGAVYMPKATHTSKTYEDVLLAIKNKGLKVITAKTGVDIKVDNSIAIKMLSPSDEKYDNLNDYSPVIKLTYNKNSFLFTGDAEEIVEKEVLNKKLDINADVLKVGHHGSDTSSTDAFINSVSPKYSVISVGVNNSYKHPTKQVLYTLKNYNSEVFRTDIDGTIVAISDGENISMTKKGKIQQANAPPKSSSKPNPSPSKPTTTTKTNPVVSEVYITKTGEKYHRDGCNSLSKSKISIDLENAKKKGYTPCSKCNP